MDNQQERLVSLDFIAGLLVGEGSFCFNVVPNRGRGVINPVFQVHMTDRETMEIVHRSLQAEGLPGYFHVRPKARQYREQYGIRVSGVKRVKRYCDALVPYLTGDKLRAAKIAQGFCDYRLSLPRAAPYSPKDVEFVAQMRTVNRDRSSNKTSLEELPRILRDYTPCPSNSEGEDIVHT